ncbi:hypothetical protein scyTo_0008008 [Scyliorhinus torazame]|uniref:Uncharacterized protein n=1 Tax=Scyliorhinus torazame TaxID=75743 RepID=A0A401P247_SCYTO|nr:hypothetical protein [Scyliorhinus torazame]
MCALSWTTDRPEQRTPLMGRVLVRYKVDNAAISETRHAEEGQLRKIGPGYAFCSGHAIEDWRKSGAGFAVKNELVNKLTILPKGLNNRHMSLKILLAGTKQATISAYVPTVTNPEPKRHPLGKKIPKRLNISRLKIDYNQQQLPYDPDKRLNDLQPTSEDIWASLRDTVYATAYETLDPTRCKHWDWFDENYAEIEHLIEEKYKLHRAYLNDKSTDKKTAYNNICNTVQRRLHETQDKWLSQKADEIQTYADKNDMKRFYESVRMVFGHQ